MSVEVFELERPQAARVWSAAQSAVFHAVCDMTRTDHVVVIARAGSGKTTTIIEAVCRLDASARVLLCAFNKAIATELENRFAKLRSEGRGPKCRVDVRTLHSLGYAAVRNAWGSRVKPESKRDKAVLDRVVPAAIAYADRGVLAKIISFAKAHLVYEVPDLRPMCDAMGFRIDWNQYIDRRGRMPYGDADMFRWVQQALDAALERSIEISFDDMCYIPACENMKTGDYTHVFVDETQDMNKCQLTLALAALRPGGRVVAIGDDRQAIYAFRGADAEAIPRLIRELSATVLPLSTSYRCGKAIAALAQRIVPDFDTPADAPQGEVIETSVAKARAEWKPGDFVLSRTNAPLIRLCLAALADGTRAYIQGRDIGAALEAMARKSRTETIVEFLAWVAQWERQEIERLVAAQQDDRVEDVRDKAQALVVLTDGLTLVSELLARIGSLFADDGGARLMFSSVHRAKGLEADRVWMFQETFRPGKNTEEDNLWYTSCTRAKSSLFLVSGVTRNGSTNQSSR